MTRAIILTNFIDLWFIWRRFKRKTVHSFKVDRVVQYHRKYPGHVVAFDIVGEEDAGYSLLYHVDALVELHDKAIGGSTIPIYLHNAETNWPDDLMTSFEPEVDISTTQDDTLDAVLLGASRVGHGLGLLSVRT